MENELFKDVPGYEGFYQVSNLGNIKSLSRVVTTKVGFKTNKERILKPSKLPNGYLCVVLCKFGNRKQYYIHQLSAMAFLKHMPCKFTLVVDHKDNNKLNNYYKNLRTVTNRQNSNQSHLNSSSKYVGVRKYRNKWRSDIRVGDKKETIGIFENEYDAHLEYQKRLKEITKNDIR